MDSIPGQGSKTLQATWYGQKKKENKIKMKTVLAEKVSKYKLMKCYIGKKNNNIPILGHF